MNRSQILQWFLDFLVKYKWGPMGLGLWNQRSTYGGILQISKKKTKDLSVTSTAVFWGALSWSNFINSFHKLFSRFPESDEQQWAISSELLRATALRFACFSAAPGSSLLHQAGRSASTCLTADADKLDSVHSVENYNTWPVGLETRLARAPFSRPCLLHLSSGALLL